MKYEAVSATLAQTMLDNNSRRAYMLSEWMHSWTDYMISLETMGFSGREANMFMAVMNAAFPTMNLRMRIAKIVEAAAICACDIDWHPCNREQQYADWALYGDGRRRN